MLTCGHDAPIIRFKCMACSLREKYKKIPFTPLTRAGTGKTYASAFAMRELGFKRVLFLVHRNQIAKQAKASFERVFGSETKNGFVSRILQESKKFGGYILNAQRRDTIIYSNTRV